MKWVEVLECVSIFFLVFLSTGLAEGQGFRTQARRIAPAMPCLIEFKAMDKDKDSKVTKEEFMAVPYPDQNAQEIFESLDMNGVGYLTIKEYCIAPLKQCMEDFRSYDKDLDGVVSRIEFMAVSVPGQDAEVLFGSLDTDGDDYLSKEEYCFYRD